MDREKFILVAKNKAIIKQLQAEVDENENELRKTFTSDVKQFFLSKGFEFKQIEDKYRNPDYENVFINLRQIDDKSTFTNYRGEPKYYIAGKNNLIVRFVSQDTNKFGYYHYFFSMTIQTLDDFFERRLKKTLILPIKIERKNKLSKLEDYDSLTDYNPFGCENIPISKITGGIAIGGQNPDEILEKLNIKDIENLKNATASSCDTGNIMISSITSRWDFKIRLYSVTALLVTSFIRSTLTSSSIVLK